MGMFDTVRFACPRCLGSILAQSKAGDCVGAEYEEETVPLGVADDLQRRQVKCSHCGVEAMLHLDIDVKTVKMKAVRL